MPPYDISPPPPPPSDLTSPESPDILPSVAASADTQSAPAAPILNPIPSSPGEGGSPQSEPPSPGVVLITPTPPPHLIHPIPGILEGRQTHMFSGSSGAGKTTWLGWFMGEFLNRGSVLSHPTSPLPFVAYIAGDRTIYDALHKLEKAGWQDPPYYSLVNDPSPEADRYLDALRRGGKSATTATLNFFSYVLKTLQERYFPSQTRIPHDSFLWIDGMAPFFGIEPAGSYMKAVAAPFISLNRFCASYHLTCALVHHASKQKTDSKYQRSQDRALGSVAVQGFTSTQMSLTEPELTDTPDSGITTFEWRPHAAPHEAHDFRRSSSTGLFEYVGPHWEVPAVHPAAPEAALLPYIVDHEWTSSQAIREVCGEISRATFHRWLDKLVSSGLVAREDRDGGVAWYRKRVFQDRPA
jgi:hypothetical protein